MVVVGGSNYGESGFLIMLLLWTTSAYCFKKIFKEVAIVFLQEQAAPGVARVLLDDEDSLRYAVFGMLFVCV